MITVSRLFVYPLKSARGIALDAATLSDRGLVHDRRFMAVDEHGHMFTQRELPALARLETAIEPPELALGSEGQRFRVPLQPSGRTLRKVRVFRDQVDALDLGDEAARFVSAALERPARLVYMPDQTRRQVDPEHAGERDIVGFADAFPDLLASEASLAALNRELPAPVPIQRFRPNIVIAGADAYAEDGFRELRIGDVSFVAVKLSSRCVIVNTDQETGVREKGVLETLTRTHAIDRRPIFGQNLVARGGGRVQVGDPVLVMPPS